MRRPLMEMAESGTGRSLGTDEAPPPPGKDAGSVACSARERPRTPHGGGRGRQSADVNVAVVHSNHDVIALLEVAPDAVGDGDRAVAAAGAADRDRQVALALVDVGGNEELEQRAWGGGGHAHPG